MKHIYFYLDVATAFLNDNLKNNMYAIPNHLLNSNNDEKVLKLKKRIHELKQSSRAHRKLVYVPPLTYKVST